MRNGIRVTTEQAGEADGASHDAVLNTVPVGIIETDASARILSANEHFARLAGRSVEDLIGRDLRTLNAPGDGPGQDLSLADVVAGRVETWSVERTLVGPGGDEVPVLFTARAQRELDGTLDRIVAGAVDISELVAARRALQESHEQARALQLKLSETTDLIGSVLDAATGQAILAVDMRGMITLFNPGAEAMLGWSEAEILGTSVMALHDPAEVAQAAAARGMESGIELLQELAASVPPRTEEWTYLTKKGQRLTVALTITSMRNAEGALVGFIGVASDITARKRAESAILESEQRFRLAFDNAPIGMMLTDLTPPHVGVFQRVNRALCEMTGYRESELIGQSFEMLNHPEDLPQSKLAFKALVSGAQRRWEAEKRYRHADGHTIWVHLTTAAVNDANGVPSYTVSHLQDITARKQAEEQLVHLALHDGLTGLPNRILLLDHLSQALARAERSRTPVAVMFLDLDNFKDVNDSLGHSAGDAVLVEIASRITGCLRDTDTAARLGGDEFAVICEDLDSAEDIHMVARRLASVLAVDVTIGHRAIRVGASIGVAIADPNGHVPTPNEMLRDADAAMYRAKDNGKGRYELADAELQALALRRITLEADLRVAMSSGQLFLDYQPCWDLDSGRVYAVEALLRWNHPRLGLLGPDQFLDIAEDRDLIVPLGTWVLRTACAQGAEWQRRFGDGAPNMWVNISSRQLGRHQLTDTVRRTLDEFGLQADKLCLELTERQVVGAAHSVQADLHALPEMGVKLAIDDFGTGHNGFDYLRHIPVDAIKIDKSYVAGLGHDRTDTALTTGIIHLAASLGLTVIAEGVENEQQQSELSLLGCHYAQGFLYLRPGPASEVERFLST